MTTATNSVLRKEKDPLSAPTFFQRMVAEYGIHYWQHYFAHEIADLKLEMERSTIKISELRAQLDDCRAFLAQGETATTKAEDGNI